MKRSDKLKLEFEQAKEELSALKSNVENLSAEDVDRIDTLLASTEALKAEVAKALKAETAEIPTLDEPEVVVETTEVVEEVVEVEVEVQEEVVAQVTQPLEVESTEELVQAQKASIKVNEVLEAGHFKPAKSGKSEVKTQLYSANDFGSKEAIGLGELSNIVNKFGANDLRTVATFETKTETAFSTHGSATGNSNRLVELASSDTMQAAFASCSPAEVLRAIITCFQGGTPFRDIFRTYTAERGSIKFLGAANPTDLASNVYQWTQDDQDDVTDDPATWKPCAVLDCPDEITVGVDPIVACAALDTFKYATSPEALENIMLTLMALMDRATESRYLDLFDATAYNINALPGPHTTLGAIPEVRAYLAWAAGVTGAQNRSRDLLSGYTAVIDNGIRQVLEIDSGARCNETGNGDIDGIFGEFGIDRVVTTNDFTATYTNPWAAVVAGLPVPGAAAAAALPIPTDYRMRLVPTYAYVALEVPQVDINMQILRPDTSDTRKNRKTLFAESFIGLAKLAQCAASFTFDIDICGNGVRAACAAPAACV